MLKPEEAVSAGKARASGEHGGVARHVVAGLAVASGERSDSSSEEPSEESQPSSVIIFDRAILFLGDCERRLGRRSPTSAPV